MIDIVSVIASALILLGYFDQLENLSELFQSMWGGKVRELKSENRRLQNELRRLRG